MVGLAQPMPKKVSRSQLDRQLDRARNQGNSIEFLNSTEQAAFTKKEITRGARRILKTLTKEDEEEIEREGDDSQEEGEEVNQEIEESEHESNENVPMEEEESEEEEDELPMYQEHYDALFSMDFVETKYPHDDTMKALGIFEMWSWSSRTCAWPSSSLTAWSHTRSSLVSSWLNEVPQVQELDRAELDQGWGWITFLARGERRSKAAQIRSPVLRYVHKALANTFFARKGDWDNQ
ncbi:unnamed protein product [Microthlaspi erraticum]|uniref:Arabidopsis retrotransposon Orf1 C-terminal domain-containing protein n=1 Tax=Microthlaspi erraticum TaxID=1685480 RepID=A0A6D2HNQ6_9BRAS|nr:unnamed protein product [Microthlaspi erraticum]